jgi:hypothetical protein
MLRHLVSTAGERGIFAAQIRESFRELFGQDLTSRDSRKVGTVMSEVAGIRCDTSNPQPKYFPCPVAPPAEHRVRSSAATGEVPGSTLTASVAAVTAAARAVALAAAAKETPRALVAAARAAAATPSSDHVYKHDPELFDGAWPLLWLSQRRGRRCGVMTAVPCGVCHAPMTPLSLLFA